MGGQQNTLKILIQCELQRIEGIQLILVIVGQANLVDALPDDPGDLADTEQVLQGLRSATIMLR